ncbi:hypothetical protein ABPG75_008644 [Micractinium tetrahymenae]
MQRTPGIVHSAGSALLQGAAAAVQAMQQHPTGTHGPDEGADLEGIKTELLLVVQQETREVRLPQGDVKALSCAFRGAAAKCLRAAWAHRLQSTRGAAHTGDQGAQPGERPAAQQQAQRDDGGRPVCLGGGRGGAAA